MNKAEQEKIYVEVDEEITNVIDHIHRAKTNDILIVAPQHALLLQSVVNLKLMAQEAKKYNKKLTLMTRDEDGIAFATRAGIPVQPFVAQEHESWKYEQVVAQKVDESEIPTHAKEIMEKPLQQRTQIGLGSKTFFNTNVQPGHSVSGLIAKQSQEVSNKVIKQDQEIRAQEKSAYMKTAPKQQIVDQQQSASIQQQNIPVQQQSVSTSQQNVSTQQQNTPTQQQNTSHQNYKIAVAPGFAGQNEKQNTQNIVSSFNANDPNVFAGSENVQQFSQQYPNNFQQDVATHTNQNQTMQNEADRMQQAQVQTQYPNMQTSNNQSELSDYEQSLRAMQIPTADVVEQNEFIQQTYHNEQQEVLDNKSKKVKSSEGSAKKSKVKKKKQRKTKSKKSKDDVKMPETTNNLIKGFVIAGIVLVVTIFLIILLPKTYIEVTPKEININETMELTAKVDQTVYDAERRLIPARLIERDITYAKTFDATGTGDVTAQKAQGTITIYNEYSSAPQPLVATTRFLAEDGTLFRLVNQTTVPGMNGDEPGKVDALVEADQPGEAGNIGPTRFSVPGFDGSPKKGKFYGVSEKSMAGGGSGGNGVPIVTEDDIARAKTETTNEMPDYVKEQVGGLLRPEDEVLLPEAIATEELRSEASVSPGTMAEQFMYEVVVHVKALVFSEDDVLAVMESNLDNKGQQYNEDQIDVTLDYTNVVADFEKQVLEMVAKGEASVIATVDVESFKEDIVGKKHDELQQIIEEQYDNQIDKIVLESIVPGFPAFISNHISRFPFMTTITVE